MARALAGVINALDPDVIVLGGGISNLSRLCANVPARWARFVFSDTVTTRLVAARHGDSSGAGRRVVVAGSSLSRKVRTVEHRESAVR